MWQADLAVVLCGINPGLWSAATGHHFARPGNRFWSALHQAGFTPRQLDPAEQADLLAYGLGITNLVARGTARADELTAEELRAGVDFGGKDKPVAADLARGTRRQRVIEQRLVDARRRIGSPSGWRAPDCGSSPTRAASMRTIRWTAWSPSSADCGPN